MLPELIMLVGIPACGKSTLAAQYEKNGYTVLSSDKIRNELAQGEDYGKMTSKEYRELNVRVFEAIKKKASTLIKQKRSVVVDSTAISRKKRIGFLRYIGNASYQKTCVLVITPVEVCMERNSKRQGNARVPHEAIDKMLRSFECPAYVEGWDKIETVAYNGAYSFPFNEAADFPQDNPYHTLTLGGHMDAAVEYCIQQNYPEIIRHVAAYHDVGKLYTKQFRNYKGEPTESAHFYGHESYSAYLYLTEMLCGKTVSDREREQILYCALLINCHMRPMFRREGSYEEDVALFGERFMDDLMMLHSADRAAH